MRLEPRWAGVILSTALMAGAVPVIAAPRSRWDVSPPAGAYDSRCASVRAALRAMATKYPYDIIEDKDVGGIALSSHQEVIAQELQISVEERLKRAGIEVLEARISHLAYSQEIAQAMLRRQQASAVVAARSEIVKGAVGMVELALEQLSQKNIIELDEDKKASMVSNLLVVLCSETDTTPVVNTGTLYQ